MHTPNAKRLATVEKLDHAWSWVANQADYGTPQNQLALDILMECGRYVRRGPKMNGRMFSEPSYLALYFPVGECGMIEKRGET